MYLTVHPPPRSYEFQEMLQFLPSTHISLVKVIQVINAET